MEHHHRLLPLLLLLLAVSWPAAATAATEACHDGDQHPTHPGCVDASGLARRHGDVWRERAGRRAGGGCVRRVSACVDGRLLRPVSDRVERCPRAAANHACRMESFFTCCPIYDCPSKLASLISPLSPGQDPSNPAVETFLSRVEVPELFEADALSLPVARPQLNASAIRQLLGWLSDRPAPPSAAERAVQTELRHILTVLEAAGAPPPPPEPAEARGTLRLLRQLAAPRRQTAAVLLRLLLDRLDSGELEPPLTVQLMLSTVMELADSGRAGVTVGAADLATVTTALFRLQLDSRETPIDQLLRYIVLYGRLDTETEQEEPETEPEPESEPVPEPVPEPDSRTTTEEVCSEDQEGLVWAQMEVPVDGRCTRQVRACRGGRVVTSAQLRDRQHVCDASGPELCRVFSFFTCCPVFDCREQLETLRGLDPRFITRDTLTPEQFLDRVSAADLASVTSPVPIVGRSLHIQTIVGMRGMVGNRTLHERLVRQELDQIVGLFEPDSQPAVPGAEEILQRLVPTLDDIGVSVTLRGPAVSPATVLDMLLTVQRVTELRNALTAGTLPESVVPAGLPGAAARLLLVLTSTDRAGPPRGDLHQLVLSVAGGRPVVGPQLAALLEELGRVLDAWLDTLPESVLALLPELGSLGPDSPPTSLTALLWRLLPAGDGSQPAPLVPQADRGSPEDGPLLEAVLQLVEWLQRSGEPTGPLRPALVRLVRQLARPDGADSPEAVRLLLELVRRLARGPTGLQPDLLRIVVDLLGRLGSHQRPDAAPHVLQLLLQLVERMTPRHRVVGPEIHAMIAELLQQFGSRPSSVTPASLQLLVTVVRQLGEVTRRDVRPVILGHLVTLLGRLGDTPAAADPAALRVLVRLVGRLGETQPVTENVAVLRLLLQMLETLTTAPEGAAPDSVQLVIRLVEQLGRPDTDTAGSEVTQLILQLIEGLQRPQQPTPPQLGQQLVQLVVQLARRHGPAAPPLQQLLLALLPLLSAQAPRSHAPDGLLQVLLTMVEGVTEGRTAQGGGSELHQLLLQLTEQLSAERRPLPAPVRKLLLELFMGTQTGGVTDSDVMSLVLTMLELMSQAPDTPAATVGFNISTVVVDKPDPDVRDLRRLIELLFAQDQPGGRTASPADITGVITVLLGEQGSDSDDTDQLLRLLLGLVETEMSTPSVPGFLNITAVLSDSDQKDFTDILQLLEVMITQMNSSRPRTPGFINITGIIGGEEPDGLEDVQQIIEMLLARMTTMADKPSEPGYFNITLINETPNQFDEFRSLLEMILLEIETMESNPQPTGILNISTVLVDGSRRDYTKIQEMLTMLMAQLTARTEAPRTPGFINISLVQEDRDEFRNVRYLLELLMSQLRRESVSEPQPGFLNISGVLVSPGRDDFGDIQSLLERILAQMSASQTPDFPGFFNISGILVNSKRTEMQSLRTMLEMVMSRMSAGSNMPKEELSAFRELVMRFFSRSSGSQDIDVQGITNMLIELGGHDTGPTFSIADFIALIQSLDVPEDHPTFTDDIRRLIVLLQEGNRSSSFLSDLTEVVVRLLRLVETSGGSADVSPEMLIRFIVQQTTQPADSGPDGLEGLLAALVGLLGGSAGPRQRSFTFGVVVPPPDSLPASLRDLVRQLQPAVRQPRPLLQSLPQLLQLLTGLAGPYGSAPDSLRFAAQLATAVLERAPGTADRVLVPQILLQLRQLSRQPRPDRLTTITGLLRRLLLLEQQRRPTDPAADGGQISVTVISEGNSTNTELMTLLRGLLEGRASAGGASPLPELTQGLLDVLLRTERDGGEARLADLLPQLVSVLRLAVEPPADAGRLPDDTLVYVAELTRAVLERLEPRADPLLPRVLLLLRRLGPRPQPDALREVLAVLEQLLARQQGAGVTVVGGSSGGLDGVPAELLNLLLRLEEISERGRPAEYLPLMVTLLRRAELRPDRADPALMTYLTELVRAVLRRDAGQLDPLLAPRVLTLISGGDGPADITELLPVLELLVSLQPNTDNGAGFGDLSDLFGLLTLGGSTAGGGGDAPLDLTAWLANLPGPGLRGDAPAVSQTLLSHLVHLLRQRASRPDHDVEFVSPEEAERLLPLVSGQQDDPAAVPVSALDSVLSLLDPSHELRPTDTASGLLRALMLRVWGAAGRPGSSDPAALYRQLLGVLADRPVELPVSEAALRRALLLLLAGPAAAQPTEDTEEAARLLLTLLTRPGGGGDPRLVSTAVLRLLDSLLEASAAGGRTAALPEPALRHLVRLLAEPDWRSRQPAPEELVRLLVAAVTASPDTGRHSVHRVALRLLLRLLGDRDAHRMIPIREDWLRALLTMPDGRSGVDSDSDSEDALRVLMSLLSDPSVSSLPDGFMAGVLPGSDSQDGHQDHGGPGDQSGLPAVPDAVYRLLTEMMVGQPAGSSGGDPASPPLPLYQRLLSLLGEGGFEPDQVPDSVYTELTELLSADQFDPAAVSGEAPRLLAALGGGRLQPERLFRRLLLLLARRRGLPAGAVTPPGRLLRRCRLLCDAAAGPPGVQVLPGRTPITFIGENHVIVLNG